MTAPCWRCARSYELDRCALPASWYVHSPRSGHRIAWAMLCGPCTYAAAAATQLDAQAADRAPIRVLATVGRSR